QFLMIHGDCSSAGCYAMTDEQIAEIYALARESFFGGQRSFQIQAYPFRMTPLNMAKHRNSPHMAFWKMLKQGNDHFEVTKREPEPATSSFGTQSASTTRVASAGDSGSSGNWFGGLFTSNTPNSQEQPSSSDGVFDRMSRFVGLKGSDPAPEPAGAQKKKSAP